MSPKSLLMVAAAVLSVTALSSASGAVVRGSSDAAPIARELGTAAAPVVLGVRSEAIGAEDITIRADEGTDQHIVQTGLWSSVKKAAKAVGSTVKKAASTVKKAAGTVKTVGGKVMDAGAKVGSKLPRLVKKAVTTTVKNLTPPVVKKVLNAAKKAAQKVMTPVGKKIAKVIS